ncbi:MAG: hypothetical protein HOI66_08505 [Verrucomicrobia bacterium]|nr:hypothetical protein [Verrucomicrobiota bacterium]
MKERFVAGYGLVLGGALFCGLAADLQLRAAQTLVISEFMALNDSVVQDAEGEFVDWIEVHNYGEEPVDLSGFYLTDSRRELSKWPIGNSSLEAGEFLTLFTTEKGAGDDGESNAKYGLKAKGDYLALVDSLGRVIQDFGKDYPKQKKDISYGLSSSWQPGEPLLRHSVFLERPTPGKPNSGALLGEVKSVTLSHKRGFYDGGFKLTLKTKTEGATIRYTVDGSVPSSTHGTVCSGPIDLSKTTVLRVAGFMKGYRSSSVKSHTYVFPNDVIRQSPDGLPPESFPYLWGQNQIDYGMDPDVVDDPRYRDEIVDGLKSIPTLSLVTDIEHLFDEKTGIYSNAGQQGREWERPCSLELVHPNGDKGFQVDCGLRIRGGYSRQPMNPKHAFRLFFRDEYGPTKLDYPLFGKDGAKEFDNIDLRTSQNYSWSYQLDTRSIFLRDPLCRDLQLAMNEPGARGEFYHLYLNGQYWGIYNACERIKAAFGESYRGGKKGDYDVVKIDAGYRTSGSTMKVVATDGDRSSWDRLYEVGRSGLSQNEAYFAIQGLNTDGSPSSHKEALVDVDNLIQYMLVIFYGGNLDAPVTIFAGNKRPNNWQGLIRRGGDEGFQFFVWDAEHTFLDVTQDRTGPFDIEDSVDYGSPQWIWEQCLENAEFRLRVADLVYRHFFNRGLLTPSSMRERVIARANEIESAVICESARWGDMEVGFTHSVGPDPRRDKEGKVQRPFNRDDDWRREIDRIVNDYIPKRSDIVLGQLYRQGLFPDIDPPQLNEFGGKVPSGFDLEMESPEGEIYYTTDGSDPRRVGGGVADHALRYRGGVELRRAMTIKARVRLADDWSALSEAKFKILRN